MSSAPDHTLFLTGDLSGGTDGQQVGGLDLVLPEAVSPVPFTLLDDFDRSVRASGQMLIEAGGELILWTDTGAVMQDARRDSQFLTGLPAGPVTDALRHLSPLRALLVIGNGTLHRRQLALTDDEGKTQARALLTSLHPAGDGRPVAIATLQGLRGYDQALQALRVHLRAASDADGPASLPGLLFPRYPESSAKPEVGISAGDMAWQAATDIIAAHLAVARQNEAGIIADHDTEFLHGYRVALRKVRSVISLFKGVYSPEQTAMLKRTTSDLMSPTGRLRDLDVYLLARDDYFAMLPPTLHDGLALMFDMLAQERQREHRRIRALLDGRGYQQAIADLQALFASPPGPAPGPHAGDQVKAYARKLIWKRYRKVCAIAAVITADTDDAKVHELRIMCKKLRYLIEFFAPLFPAPDIKKLLKPLKKLQDNLGLFNDYSVQQAALSRFMQAHEAVGHKQDLILAQSIGALIAVLHARQAAERDRIMSSFAQFDGPGIRKKFRGLFHGKEPSG